MIHRDSLEGGDFSLIELHQCDLAADFSCFKQLFQSARNIFSQPMIRAFWSSNSYEIVPGRQKIKVLRSSLTKNSPQLASQAISLHCFARLFADRIGHSPISWHTSSRHAAGGTASSARVLWRRIANSHIPGARSHALLSQPLEIRPKPKATNSVYSSQAESRFLPLARRARTVALPALCDILLRNPCRLARRRTFG